MFGNKIFGVGRVFDAAEYLQLQLPTMDLAACLMRFSIHGKSCVANTSEKPSERACAAITAMPAVV